MDDIMKSVYIREENWYTLEDLTKLFNYEIDKTKKLLKKFISYGILKVKYNKKNEADDFIEVVKEIINIDSDERNKYFYKFTFVGIFMVSDIILKCYPKYILNKPEEGYTPLLKQVLKVISKMNKKKIVSFYEFQNLDMNNKEFNLIETMLYLLKDYYDYGVYTSIENTYEINGIKEINWEKTINESFVFYNNTSLFYPELITKKVIEDDKNFIKRLHQIILTQCIKNMKHFGLLELFDIQEFRLSDEELSDLADRDYILKKLEKEQKIQYNTRKLTLLRVMYNFINGNYDFQNNSEFSFYGVSSFHVIWQKVCEEVFEDKLYVNLNKINLPKKLIDKYKGYKELIDVIEKPKWEIDKGIYNAKKSLEPDGISIYKDESGKFSFIIFDAKYRIIESKPNITGLPGIGEITKQYLYQLDYNEFIEYHDFNRYSNNIYNFFLFPTDEDRIRKRGRINLELLERVGLKNIQIISLPAQLMYNLYLNNKKLDDIYPEMLSYILSKE